MARQNTEPVTSDYYPPRARWYSWLFYLGDMVRRRLSLDRIHLPREMTFGGLVASFVVPGLAVHIRGPRLWGKATLLGCGLLMLLFMAGFGHPVGNLAFGLLLSIHTTGFVYYCSPLLLEAPFRSRLLFTMLSLLAVGLLIYAPIRYIIQEHWLVPLRVRGQVIIVHRLSAPIDVQRGDWVMYSLADEQTGEAHHGGAVWVRSGFGFGPVLAVAGDRVVFSTKVFRVNGKAQLLLPHMPTSGKVVVPENHWFIWPEFDISGHGNVGEANISAAMLDMAVVSQKQFLGQPFKRWLWGQQVLP